MGRKKLKPSQKSKFITFEGGEGAGKTTLIEEVVRTLSSEKRPLLRTREPGGTELGESVRQILLQKTSGLPMSPYAELSLFLASRAQHIAEVILPALREGKIVLCDRFNDSSIAYQGGARNLGVEEVARVCHFFSQGLEPDLTLYLDIDPEIGLSRVGNARVQDRIETETLAFHKKIRETYHLLHRKDPKRLHLIDASKPPSEVYQEAMTLIHRLVKHV